MVYSFIIAGNNVTGNIFLGMTDDDIDRMNLVFGPRKLLKVARQKVMNEIGHDWCDLNYNWGK